MTTILNLDHQTSLSTTTQGAHITSWRCAGVEQLFLSKASKFGEGDAIRGGVPIIFPQFGEFGDVKRHGFARTSPWQPVAQNDDNTLSYRLRDSDATRAIWPHPFEALFSAHLHESALQMTLQITNTGSARFDFTCALHTYFAVSDITQTHIHGLKGHKYWDNNGSEFSQRYVDERDSFALNAPLDRIYFNAQDKITLSEPAQRREIKSEGFKDTVVWNPWHEGADALSDMHAEEHQHMLCVEAAIVDSPIQLAPHAQWVGTQTITIL